MMLERDEIGFDTFGLAGTFPRPGWVVLDAARHHGFTGELTFGTIPSAKVYLDGGLIYLAERVTDPSLGSRLIDAGALNAAQLEHGSIIVGDIAHLGRLFERVPSVNRQTVMVMTEMMTEECVGWLAGQLVRYVEAAPYRHHPAGVQRWLQRVGAPSLMPGDPLPSPPLDEVPVELTPPEPLFSPVGSFLPDGSFDDDLIMWDQTAWLDQRLPAPPVLDLLYDDTSPAATVAVETNPEPIAPTVSKPQAPLVSSAFEAPNAGPLAAPTQAEGANSLAPPSAATADWADLVAAVVEPGVPDEPGVPVDPGVPDVDPPFPTSDPHDARDGRSSAPNEEPLPVRRPARHQATLASSPSALSGPATAHTASASRSVPGDWIDHFETDGLPEPGGEPLVSTEPLAPTHTAADRFELIWPSGEVDEQLGSSNTATAGDRHPDLDRIGPAARLVTSAGNTRWGGAAMLEHDLRQPELAVDEPVNGHDEVTDEVVLAVRRAVASIETSSLAARRRLVATDPDDDPSRGISDRGVRSLRPVSATSDALTPGAISARRVPTRSVFDDDDAFEPIPEPVLPAAPAVPVVQPPPERVGALRRLIGSLRGR